MKRILVPTDFSQEAENALKVAAQLAKKHASKIYAMNMLDLPLDLVSSSVNNTQEEEQLPESLFFMKLAHQRFQELLNQTYLEGVDIEETVEFNGAYEGILDGVKKYDIDLIVMGSSGASGLQEVFVGSNTEKVVRHVDIPVLVIKKPVENFSIKNLVYATDLSTKSKSAFQKALHFADTFNAKLHLVYINTVNNFKSTQEIDESLNEFTADIPNTNFTTNIHNDYSVEKGIFNFSKKIDADMLSVATNGRKGLAHLLNGSISEDLVNHAHKPVLTFHI